MGTNLIIFVQSSFWAERRISQFERLGRDRRFKEIRRCAPKFPFWPKGPAMPRISFVTPQSRPIDIFDRTGNAGSISLSAGVLALGILAAALVAQDLGYVRTLAGAANLLLTAAMSLGFAMPAYFFAKTGRCPRPAPGSNGSIEFHSSESGQAGSASQPYRPNNESTVEFHLWRTRT
jgi:hypothetical protein